MRGRFDFWWAKAPQASRGGGAIQISNAPSGVPPRMRALVVWKPPHSNHRRCAILTLTHVERRDAHALTMRRARNACRPWKLLRRQLVRAGGGGGRCGSCAPSPPAAVRPSCLPCVMCVARAGLRSVTLFLLHFYLLLLLAVVVMPPSSPPPLCLRRRVAAEAAAVPPPPPPSPSAFRPR